MTMSSRALRWSLWLVLILTLPLPYFAIESGRIPAVQLFLFAAMTAPLLVTDFGITTGVLGALFIFQALLYGGLLFLLAGWFATRIPPSRRGAALLGLTVALVGLALLPVYLAPLSHGPGPTAWLGLWP